ncbi:MAG: ISL3 family transposase [Mycobacterium leprae]
MAARSRAESVSCPWCATPSGRVHGCYRRRLVDAAIAGTRVVIDLVVRRFRCVRAECLTVTFAEQVDGLTSPYTRYTPLARQMVESIGLALAGRAGARLAGRLGVAAGRDTMLRRVRALPDPAVGVVAVLGVDDFALRRRHVYGTVLVDLDGHRPVDLLEGRDAEPLAGWLKAHPGVEVICRDRGGAYAEGARTGAPQAVQVADRFHLWQNLGEAVGKTVTAHRAALAGPPPEAEPASSVPPPTINPPEVQIITRTRARYADVQGLLAQGFSRAAVSRTLGLDTHTVRRFANAASVEELLVRSAERASKIDPFKEHLHRRWNEGATDAARLTEQITALGYAGSAQTVRRYLHRFRDGRPAPKPGPVAPTVRDTTRWIMTRPDRLDADDQVALKSILARCPELDRLATHVADFARMMTNLEGHRLEAWTASAEADTMPALASFARHLRNDFDAVTAGLTLPYSSGAVEGTVNRIKMIERQMFGRAKFDLLRKRVLLAA